MRLESPAFTCGGRLPKRCSGDGDNLSPPLSFIEVPPGARELRLTCVDPDAPGRPWTHWDVRGLRADCGGLPEGLPRRMYVGDARQHVNGWGALGWGGPFPPKGSAHRYIFTLTALGPGGKDLARAELVAFYKRG